MPIDESLLKNIFMQTTGKTNSKIKVCSVVGALTYGGGERRILALGKQIDRERFDHSVLVLNEFDKSQDLLRGSLLEEYRCANIRVETLGEKHSKKSNHQFKLVNLFGNLLLWQRLVGRIRGWIRRNQIDIVDSHLNPANLVAPAACVTTSARSVMTLYHLKQLANRENFVVGQLAFLSAHAVVTDSKVRSEEMKRWSLAGHRRTHFPVIPNGSDPPQPSQSGNQTAKKLGIDLKPDTITIGQVSRVVPFKGQATLLRAFSELCARHQNLYLLMIGHVHDSGYLQQLEILVQELHLGDRVKIVGYQGTIGDIWQLIDIHCHPSWFDSLPNAIIEAMSLRIPTVATTVGGIPELIDSGNNGFLVEPKNVGQLAESLERLIVEASLRVKIGEAAFQTYLERCTPQIMTRNLEKLFVKLVGNRARDTE